MSGISVNLLSSLSSLFAENAELLIEEKNIYSALTGSKTPTDRSFTL